MYDCMVFYHKMEEACSVKQQREKARELLESAFLEFFGEELKKEKIFLEESGKPGYDFPGRYFNISHCRNAVAAAVAKSPVGVDIEGMRRVKSLIVKKCMDEKEKAYIGHKEEEWLEEEMIWRFLDLWTLKESYVKMTGKGIRMPLNEICFDLEDFTENYREKQEIFFVKNRILTPYWQNSVSCLLPLSRQALAVCLKWEEERMPKILLEKNI